MRASPSAWFAIAWTTASVIRFYGDRLHRRSHFCPAPDPPAERDAEWRRSGKRTAMAAESLGSATAMPADWTKETDTGFTANEGFSVVAPTRTTKPFSTSGRRISCCVLSKRWISSRKKMVGRDRRRNSFSARTATAFTSDTLVVQQESDTKGQRVRREMIVATVVFPHPGGPQRMTECGGSRSSRVRTGEWASKSSGSP